MIDISNCFIKGVNCLFAKAQEIVTLRRQTFDRNTQDDPLRTNTDIQVNVFVENVTSEDVNQYAGQLRVGDAVFFFPNNVSPALKDQVICDGVTYVIIEVLPEYALDSLIFTECRAQRYDYPNPT